MELKEIKFLIDKYYSGGISPDEYESLISSLKTVDELPQDLEEERRMLFALEGCEPIIPENFENRLIDAIDQRDKHKNSIIKKFITRSVAAAILICVTIGLFLYENKEVSHSELIADVAPSQSSVFEPFETVKMVNQIDTLRNTDTNESIKSTNGIQANIKEESISTEISEDDLEQAVHIVDEALLSVISGICMSRDKAVGYMEEIQINQKIEFNL